MRTISIRLDDHTDTLLRNFCERHGLSQTHALKAAIEQLAQQARPTPATLARELGLVGGFDSGTSDLGRNHAQHLKTRLRAKASRSSAVVGPRIKAAGA